MFAKPLKDIEYQDVYDLLFVQKQDEGYQLDYKGEPRNPDHFADKMVKIFSSFANTNGGYVILGVEEVDRKEKIFEIKGFPKKFEGKSIVEWINQKMSGSIEPKLSYPDPRVLEIPDLEDRILIVYYIPESIKKPHFNNVDHKYYIRVNDGSSPAKHYSIRDMFESTRRRQDDLSNFLAKRNLLDEDDKDFGLNSSSKKIESSHFKKYVTIPKPLFIASFLPKFTNEYDYSIHSPEIFNWVSQHAAVDYPVPNSKVFSIYRHEFNLYGVRFLHHENKSYFELHSNGYIEAGIGDSFLWVFEEGGHTFRSIHITYCIAYIMSLIDFAQKYYSFLNMDDEIFLQISFRNIENFLIGGRNRLTNPNESHFFYNTLPRNTTHRNIKIIQPILPSSLNEKKIIEVASFFAEKILLSCGESNLNLCFFNGQLDIDKLRRDPMAGI